MNEEVEELETKLFLIFIISPGACYECSTDKNYEKTPEWTFIFFWMFGLNNIENEKNSFS